MPRKDLPMPVRVQTFTIAGRSFVILPKSEYRKLIGRPNGKSKPSRRAASRRRTTQEQGDLAEARRRRADPTQKPIPWDQAKKRLGAA
jgi:hypothetical protein